MFAVKPLLIVTVVNVALLAVELPITTLSKLPPVIETLLLVKLVTLVVLTVKLLNLAP